MSPDQILAILSRLDSQDEKLKDHGETLSRIESKVDKTNGRVNKLELWQARLQGAQAAYGWVSPTAVGVVCAVVGVVAARLIG